MDTMERYSMDSMLLSMRKLEATCRLPRRIISNSGTQLVDARMLLIKHYLEEDFTWIVYPPQAHNFVGGAERMMDLLKRQMKKKLDGTHLTINELITICLEVAKILNSCPLLLECTSICPSHLLGGKGPEL